MPERRNERPLHASEVAKLDAEVKKIGAEAELLSAEATKYLAQAREATAHAREAELKTEVAQFMHDRESEKRARELATFGHDHVYNFTSKVSEGSISRCISELRYWSKQEPGCEITIVFDSPGGSMFDGMHLFDYIQELRAHGHPVVTATRGMAASMGAVLLQAGDKRVMGAETWILIHEVSAGMLGKMGEIEDEMELIKKIQERMLDIFAQRSKLSKDTLRRRWRRKDWWISSDEALEAGLVDEIGARSWL